MVTLPAPPSCAFLSGTTHHRLLWIFSLFAILSGIRVSAQQVVQYDALLSRAERTNFLETSHNADVVQFIAGLESGSPLVSVEQFGTTKMGNPLQLVIMANPKVSSPEEARASGKPVIYIQGNIHASEVEDRENISWIIKSFYSVPITIRMAMTSLPTITGPRRRGVRNSPGSGPMVKGSI